MEDIFKDKKIVLTYKSMTITGICLGLNDCKRSIWCKNPVSYNISLYEGRNISMKKREYVVDGDTIYITVDGKFKNDVILARMFCEHLPKKIEWNILPSIPEWYPVDVLSYLMHNQELETFLTQKELFAIMCRTGYSPDSPDHISHKQMTYRSIASLMGVTQERVRQLEMKAGRKLKTTGKRLFLASKKETSPARKGYITSFSCCGYMFDAFGADDTYSIVCPICKKIM